MRTQYSSASPQAVSAATCIILKFGFCTGQRSWALIWFSRAAPNTWVVSHTSVLLAKYKILPSLTTHGPDKHLTCRSL